MGYGMIRHWQQSTFLLLALFALVACSAAAPEAESTSVEVLSMTPILPTSSPQPSATPFPTETASLTPAPQPSLTATSESTATQEPTKEPTPTPAPEFGARRQNPESNQLEYWDGTGWETPQRYEVEPGVTIDVFPAGDRIIITPPESIEQALGSLNPFLLPDLSDFRSGGTLEVLTDSTSVYAHEFDTYEDASVSLHNVFLPVSAIQENWLLTFDGTSHEIPALRLTVAYRHSDGRTLYGEMVFSRVTQDQYGNLTTDFNALLNQIKSMPKTFGVFIVTENVAGRKSVVGSEVAKHYFPYDTSDVLSVYRAIDGGNFSFGDPGVENAIWPTLVDNG